MSAASLFVDMGLCLMMWDPGPTHSYESSHRKMGQRADGIKIILVLKLRHQKGLAPK